MTNEIEELHRRSKTISKLPTEIEVEEKKKFYYPVITFLSIPGRLSKCTIIKRLSLVNVRVQISILISARYWLVNHTGLPLVLRQKDVSSAAAGQFDEHESARCRKSLLFRKKFIFTFLIKIKDHN